MIDPVSDAIKGVSKAWSDWTYQLNLEDIEDRRADLEKEKRRRDSRRG